jgi:hypothetical protein
MRPGQIIGQRITTSRGQVFVWMGNGWLWEPVHVTQQ